MRRSSPPYEMERIRGGYAVWEPVTGFRVEHRLVGDAMAQMHQLLIDRRSELASREADELDERERRELDHLRSYTDFFLYGGLQCATPGA